MKYAKTTLNQDKEFEKKHEILKFNFQLFIFYKAIFN